MDTGNKKQKAITWLLEHYESCEHENNPTIKSESVFTSYIEQSDGAEINFNKAAFGKIVNQVFPDIICKSFYHPRKRYWAYIGLRRRQGVSASKHLFTDITETISVAQSNRFTVIDHNLHKEAISCVYFTDIVQDKLNILKQVNIVDGMADVKIGGKSIDLGVFGLTPTCKTLKSFEIILHVVLNIKLCCGTELIGEVINEGKKDFICRPIAIKTAPDRPTNKYFSKVCNGYLEQGSITGLCRACNKLKQTVGAKKSTSFIHMEHSYCKPEFVPENINNNPLSPKRQKILNDATSTPDSLNKSLHLIDVAVEDDFTDESCFGDEEDPNDPTFTPTKHKQSLDSSTCSTKASDILKAVIETCPSLETDEFKALLMSQFLNSEKEKTLRRWDPSIIQLWLGVWAKSPKAYTQLRQSGMVLMPSEKQLALYKNSINQKPGVQKVMLDWMKKEAAYRVLPPHGYCGGLMCDEMSIQEDLQMYCKSSDSPLVGFVDMGTECNNLFKIRHDKEKAKLSSHIMQFFFLGDSGFRFPVAHYATSEAVASEIYVMFWDLVDALAETGFTVNYCCMDGGSNNRAFLKLHFQGDPLADLYTTRNPSFPDKELVFIMDPSHEFKKIRNSLLKCVAGQKEISLNGQAIKWSHWSDAIHWDMDRPVIRVNHRLTEEHIKPDNAAKMRNKLAFEVLDKDMLHLMEVYQEDSARSDLQGTIDLLKNTSQLVSLFTDPRVVRSVDDERLKTCQEILQWFETFAACNTVDGKLDFRKHFFTKESYNDLQSLLIGFGQVVKIKLGQHPLGYMCPSRLNTDVVENFFCSMRGINGSNTNPTQMQYSKGINTILISQTVVSKKSNAGGKVTIGGALPYKFHTKKSFSELRM